MLDRATSPLWTCYYNAVSYFMNEIDKSGPDLGAQAAREAHADALELAIKNRDLWISRRGKVPFVDGNVGRALIARRDRNVDIPGMCTRVCVCVCVCSRPVNWKAFAHTKQCTHTLSCSPELDPAGFGTTRQRDRKGFYKEGADVTKLHPDVFDYTLHTTHQSPVLVIASEDTRTLYRRIAATLRRQTSQA